jgi:hypothetical protein
MSDDFDNDDFDDEDEDDDFDNDDFDDEDEDDDSDSDESEGAYYECNYCHRVFDWKPVFYSHRGTVGVFCSDACGKAAVKEMQKLEESNREHFLQLGVDIFKTLFG